MASSFLKGRHANFLAETAGKETVRYIAFANESRDTLTDEITDETTAYGTTPMDVPALIDNSPSQAIRTIPVSREKVGVEITFDAILRIAKKEIDDHEIELKIGDSFVLPGTAEKFYVVKFFTHMQVNDGFLEYVVAVARKVGRRG
jgi:hypothetical protein